MHSRVKLKGSTIFSRKLIKNSKRYMGRKVMDSSIDSLRISQERRIKMIMMIKKIHSDCQLITRYLHMKLIGKKQKDKQFWTQLLCYFLFVSHWLYPFDFLSRRFWAMFMETENIKSCDNRRSAYNKYKVIIEGYDYKNFERFKTDVIPLSDNRNLSFIPLDVTKQLSIITYSCAYLKNRITVEQLFIKK